jgi:hypothetical protein
MAQPIDPNKTVPPASAASARTEHQETLLLSDVPEATALIPEACPAPPFAVHLSPAAVAALKPRYDILGEAGHGSMGNVYKARDRETGETVALKILKPEIASDQAMMERFKNELLFARKITHKNVCRVHEFNRIGGIAYTSMEFVEGESLRSVLNRFGGLPTRKATDLILQICSGLKEAHAQGIVHRDLKPENVMIDAQGNVKIMDFGIARSMEAVTRLTGSMVGTPAYMAPEQVAGKPSDYRTDIYALGLIMYEVFTGTQAFQAENAVAVALKQMREAPIAPHEVDPSIPALIERAIMKCLEKEQSKRFQSVGDLENALRGSGTQALAPSPANATPVHSSYATRPVLSSSLYAATAMEPAPKRTSPLAWLLLGAMLVLAGFVGWHWVQVVKAAEELPPPAALPTPKPPDFALDASTAQPAPAEPVKRKADVPAAAPPPAPAPAKQALAAVSKPVEPLPARKQVPAPGLAPHDVQQRAERAFGQNPPAPAAAPLPAQETQSYLWVGRFDKIERAQNAARKIEGLGLPVTVVPRHNEKGDFYVVVTGPFGAKRIPSVIEWLQTQGFPNVREVPSFPAGARQNQNP